MIIGVDFSGAAQAGRKIWVSQATIENGILHFHELARGTDLPKSGEEREKVLPALVQWLAAFEAPLCGFDFPFALAAKSIGDSWHDWLKNEVVPCADAEEFREKFADIRRRCDIEAKTPFSPLNTRLYRQTFYGLREVIYPLLQQGALALPFDEARPGAPWLLEICPASLLKKQKLYLSYKGKSAAQRLNREIIWQEMAKRAPFAAGETLKNTALVDDEGDALDAVLAAVCVERALATNHLSARDILERREGTIYF